MSALSERYLLKQRGTVICEGRSIGQRIGSGRVRIVTSIKEMDKVQDGDVLVSDMTDPDTGTSHETCSCDCH